MSESRILIIEADLRTRRTIHTALVHEGYDVFEVRSGRAGLKLIGGQEYDLALLGEDQRGRAHVAVCQAIREHDPKMGQ
jgi:DNA-binding response OmpR family regulator